MASSTDVLAHYNTEQNRKIILREYRKLMSNLKDLKGSDKKYVRLAFEMAAEAHKDTTRKSGEPYILHPLAVARIVAEEMGLGSTAIICALLHDTVEDTELTLDDIKSEFGIRIASIIDGLTKISTVFDLKSSFQAENFRKLLLTMARDVRVILIKIADRLHNMRTMESMPRHKQLKIASETSYLYAPLAHRLGLYAIKSELEDLSMKYTEREQYRDIAQKLQATKRQRTRYVNSFIRPLKAALEKQGLKFKIYGRPKSIFSIYSKMKNKEVSFEEVYDLFAIRIILNSKPENEKSDCWKVYSIVTDFYRPNPDRLRDWVSTPKGNGYESLHTTVMGPKGKWVEVQIRTERMDEIAERGFAAHWKYKEGSQDTALDEWLLKIREILQNTESNALDFLTDFRLNLFSKEIYVFTPKGDLKILPSNATALDFAYEIHTDIGNQTIGAKVNHRLVPLSHQLSNGDQVEVITSKKQKPNEDWLQFVATGRARSKIKQALKEEQRKVARQGKEMLERKMSGLKLEFNDENLRTLVNFFQLESRPALYFQVAKRKVDLRQIKNMDRKGPRLIPPPKTSRKPTISEEKIRKTISKNDELMIFGESADKINYSFAKCCNPIPGDDVFGFITVNGEIKIHRTNCPNAEKLMSSYGYRVVKTKWTDQEHPAFLSGLRVRGMDDVGVMSKITNIISGQMKLNIRSITIDSKEGIFDGQLRLYVNSVEQLDKLIDKLRTIQDIHSVERLED